MLIHSLQRFVPLSDKLSDGWGSDKQKTKIRARENVPQKLYAKWNLKEKKYHAWQSAQHLCTSIKKWSKRNKADYNLRSGPILAVLIHSLLRSLSSFRLARRIGPILKRTHRAQRKFLCSCYQLFALVGPPGFALFTITSTWFATYLLTYSLTYRYLFSCAIVCVLVCLFVSLRFLFLNRSGLVLRSCRVSLSPFDFHIESSKCCDPWISGLAWRTIT